MLCPRFLPLSLIKTKYPGDVFHKPSLRHLREGAIPNTRFAVKRIAPKLLFLASVLLVATAQPSYAQTENVLYSFTGGADGGNPNSKLVLDQRGNLYGVTAAGVFEVTQEGTETVIGYPPIPIAGVLRVGGNFYGIADEGDNAGGVYELTKKGVVTTLCLFFGANGEFPRGLLVRDAKGNLYGATFQGGAYNAGTVYELTPAGIQNVSYSFTGGADGGYLYAGVVRDPKGNLYGTTYQGGAYGVGTVFEVTPTGTETVLHSFTGADGAYPFFAGLVRDSKGNLFGTTWGGGPWGYGTVFEVTKTGTAKVLYGFTGAADGAHPQADLILDAAGNLYGTTPSGGAFNQGTVFKVTPSGIETVLYSFTVGVDGANPYAALVRDGRGNLYGTTWKGGVYGYGTVFKVMP